MKRSRWLLQAGAAVSILALAACGTTADATDDEVEVLTIGGTFELTGPVSVLGTAWQRGAELGVEAANGDGGFEVDGKKYRWELDSVDNQGTPDRAIAATQDFRGRGVNFVLGPGLSTAIGPVINSMGDYAPLLMTPTALANNFLDQPAAKHMFITHLDDTGENGRIAGMTDILVDRFEPKRVAILGIQNDSDELYAELFTEFLTDAGVEIVYSESFPTETRDFSTYISAISTTNPDMIIGPHLDQYMNPFVAQAVQLGLGDTVFVGRPGTTVGAVADLDVADYVWPVSTRALDNPDDPRTADVRAAWEAKYGQAPDPSSFWALSYYDSVLILTQAMQKAGTVTDLDAIAEALMSETSWENTVLQQNFAGTHQAVYAPQVGFLSNGTVSYEDAAEG